MDQELKDSILKTGTTILGIVCKDGVVIASDRRVSMGHEASIVVQKDFKKSFKEMSTIIFSW